MPMTASLIPGTIETLPLAHGIPEKAVNIRNSSLPSKLVIWMNAASFYLKVPMEVNSRSPTVKADETAAMHARVNYFILKFFI